MNGNDYRTTVKDRACKAARTYYSYYGSCLECPLPACLEETGSYVRARLAKRDQEVRELLDSGCATDREAARVLGVSPRTIERAKERLYGRSNG